MMEQQVFRPNLTVALPKQDKLKTPIIEYLNSKGFSLTVSEENSEMGVLVDKRRNVPDIRVEFVRAADALLLMEKKVVDFAFIGSDVANENTSGDNPKYEKPEARIDLGIAGCTFDLAVPDKSFKDFKSPQDVNGLRIATSYPNLLKSWLKENKIEASEIIEREGGVESCIRMGLADVVADLVDTGGTLRKNKLSSAFQIATTSAVGYARKDSDVLTSMRVNEFVRELKQRQNFAYAKPAVNDLECAVA